LAGLFVVRLTYRLVEIYVLDASQPRSLGEFAQNPLTVGVFGLMAS
jgi:hypothetical protein